MHFPDGKYHIGVYKQGLLHGLGKVNFANGDYYFGEFSGGKMHGHGKFYSSSESKIIEGEFCENELINKKTE